jgi:hypothetical protein
MVRGRKEKPETKRVAFRVPPGVHAELMAICAARHIEIGSLMNSIVADARPGLLAWLREHKAALSESNGAATEGP